MLSTLFCYISRWGCFGSDGTLAFYNMLDLAVINTHFNMSLAYGLHERYMSAKAATKIQRFHESLCVRQDAERTETKTPVSPTSDVFV